MSRIPEGLVAVCDYDKKDDVIIFECRADMKNLESCFSQDVLEQIKQQYFPDTCRKAVCFISGEHNTTRETRREAALSLVGELSRRADRIMIISAKSPKKAIAELLEEFKDNPEITTELRKLFEKVPS